MRYYCRDLKVRIIGTETGIPAHVGQSFVEALRYLVLHVTEVVSALSQEMEHHTILGKQQLQCMLSPTGDSSVKGIHKQHSCAHTTRRSELDRTQHIKQVSRPQGRHVTAERAALVFLQAQRKGLLPKHWWCRMLLGKGKGEQLSSQLRRIQA